MDFMDWLSRSLLGSSQEELEVEATIEDAERLQNELLFAVEGFADEEWFPVRLFMIGVAEQQGGYVMSTEELDGLPEWTTVGWFRNCVRENLSRLAMETQPLSRSSRNS
jgi:hypothetical protein